MKEKNSCISSKKQNRRNINRWFIRGERVRVVYEKKGSVLYFSCVELVMVMVDGIRDDDKS